MAAFSCVAGVLAAILNFGFSGAGFSLSSCNHLVRTRTKSQDRVGCGMATAHRQECLCHSRRKNNAVPHAKN
jgi:hypothetical protein